jgi:hypothetical protein
VEGSQGAPGMLPFNLNIVTVMLTSFLICKLFSVLCTLCMCDRAHNNPKASKVHCHAMHYVPILDFRWGVFCCCLVACKEQKASIL